jgi:hypothetical protein
MGRPGAHLRAQFAPSAACLYRCPNPEEKEAEQLLRAIVQRMLEAPITQITPMSKTMAIGDPTGAKDPSRPPIS